tara:strand:- start:4260 stop:4490 length:231 start_codon:yes stop_codon:yes gene_type:complete
MKDIEYQAIKILKSGEPLPVDTYMELNNSGIDPEFLINFFTKEDNEDIEEEEIKDGLDPIQKEILNEFKSYQSYNI